MSAGTFDYALLREGGSWWAWVEIEGIGRRTGATSAGLRRAYRIATEHPVDAGATAADCDPYVDLLQMPDDVVEVRVDLKAGRTDLDGFSFTVVDGAVRNVAGGGAHGWGDDLFTDILAPHAPASTYALTTGMASAAVGDTTTMNVDTVSGLSVGDALWIGRETVIVTAIRAGLLEVDALRGQYNTTTPAHPLYPLGEGKLYSRPQYIKGREIRLWVNLYDASTGHPLSAVGTGSSGIANDHGEAVMVWRGAISEWSMPSINEFTFDCKSALGQLDRTIGREQYRGTARLDYTNTAWMRSGKRIPFVVERPAGDGQPADPGYLSALGVQTFHARLGDQIIECEYEEASGQFTATAYGLMGTKIPEQIGEEETFPFWDVLLTHPAPGGTDKRFFTDAVNAPFVHPADIALALATSTGTGTSGDWDVLPAKWGCAIPLADMDVQSFIDIAEATLSLRFPFIAFGWDGKPFRVRQYCEDQLLGPLGFFLHPNEGSQIAVGALREIYPSDSWPEIGEDDTVETPSGPGVSMEGALETTLARQTWSYDFDFASGKPRRILVYRHPQAIERFDEDSEVKREIEGMEVTSDAEYVIRSMAISFARWFIAPRPIVTVSVHMDNLRIAVTDGLLLTNSLLPNPNTGTRGIVQHPAAVLSRRLVWAENRIELACILLDEPAVALWAPAAKIVSWDLGTLTFTVEANEFTKASGASGVPARDVLGFAVPDWLMLVSARGDVLCDAVQNVTSIEAGAPNTIAVSGGFTLLGAPVAIAAGQHLVFAHYAGGATPAAAWTTGMREHAVQADDATGQLPNGDGAIVYGGL